MKVVHEGKFLLFIEKNLSTINLQIFLPYTCTFNMFNLLLSCLRGLDRAPSIRYIRRFRNNCEIVYLALIPRTIPIWVWNLMKFRGNTLVELTDWLSSTIFARRIWLFRHFTIIPETSTVNQSLRFTILPSVSHNYTSTYLINIHFLKGAVVPIGQGQST